MLKGKNILVVGATGKIGENLVQNIILNGGTVIGTSRHKKKVEELNYKFNNLGSNSKAFKVNLLDEKSIKTFLKKIKNTSINGYVHNAYNAMDYAPVGKVPWGYWARNILISLGSFEKISSKLVSNISISKIESIVTISSIYAKRAPQFEMYPKKMNPNPIYYGATKAALLNASLYLAALWGKEGVRVNSVAPGGIASDQEFAFLKKYKKTVPLKRMVSKKEVVNAIIFLLSSKSTGVNGINFTIDAGKTVW